jgi:hypothetical protein
MALGDRFPRQLNETYDSTLGGVSLLAVKKCERIVIHKDLSVFEDVLGWFTVPRLNADSQAAMTLGIYSRSGRGALWFQSILRNMRLRGRRSPSRVAGYGH